MVDGLQAALLLVINILICIYCDDSTNATRLRNNAGTAVVANLSLWKTDVHMSFSKGYLSV